MPVGRAHAHVRFPPVVRPADSGGDARSRRDGVAAATRGCAAPSGAGRGRRVRGRSRRRGRAPGAPGRRRAPARARRRRGRPCRGRRTASSRTTNPSRIGGSTPTVKKSRGMDPQRRDQAQRHEARSNHRPEGRVDRDVHECGQQDGEADRPAPRGGQGDVPVPTVSDGARSQPRTASGGVLGRHAEGGRNCPDRCHRPAPARRRRAPRVSGRARRPLPPGAGRARRR